MKKLDEEMGTKAKDFSKIKKKQKTTKNNKKNNFTLIVSHVLLQEDKKIEVCKLSESVFIPE